MWGQLNVWQNGIFLVIVAYKDLLININFIKSTYTVFDIFFIAKLI